MRLFFSTGFDTRSIAAAAQVTVTPDAYGLNLAWPVVPNADYYDIFRRTNGGALTWVGRSLGGGFTDVSAVPGSSNSYVVRSRNDNTYLDSAATTGLVWETFRISSISLTGTGGRDVQLAFTTYPNTNYGVQQSTSLDAGAWTNTGVTVSGTGTVRTATVSGAGLSGRAYFRIVME